VLSALAPILAILVLMLALRWPAARAGLAALALTVAFAHAVFGFGDPSRGPGALRAYTGVAAEGGFLALTMLWILWPALALHRVQQDSGAIETLRGGLSRLTEEPALQALLVGWLLALFFEGAAGFGTPVALAAPILVSLGIAPVQAVVLALLGHAAGVSFGALGTPVFVQAALTGLDAVEIAWRTALLHALLGGILMLFFVRTMVGTGTDLASAGLCSRPPASCCPAWRPTSAASARAGHARWRADRRSGVHRRAAPARQRRSDARVGACPGAVRGLGRDCGADARVAVTGAYLGRRRHRVAVVR
jgi:lactate permease